MKEQTSNFNYDRYIKKLANKFGRNEFNEDLEQEGQIGLMIAKERYQPEIGDFHNYAQWYIKGYMQKYLTDYSRLVRVPSNIIKDKENFQDNQSSNISFDQPLDEDKTYLDVYGPIQEEFEIIENNPILGVLRQYISQLKERYQLILKLRYFEGKTITQIAEILDISRQAVDLQLAAALGQLQEKFGLEKKRNKGERIKKQKTPDNK